MKNFKKIAIASILSLFVVAGMLNTGCKSITSNIPVLTTNANGTITTNFVTTTVTDTNLILSIESVTLQLGTQYAVKAVLNKNPGDTNYFQLVAQSLNASINSGVYDTNTLNNALNKTVGSNLSEITPFIEQLVAIYASSEAGVVTLNIDKNVFLLTGLKAVYTGIEAVIPPNSVVSLKR